MAMRSRCRRRCVERARAGGHAASTLSWRVLELGCGRTHRAGRVGAGRRQRRRRPRAGGRSASKRAPDRAVRARSQMGLGQPRGRSAAPPAARPRPSRSGKHAGRAPARIRRPATWPRPTARAPTGAVDGARNRPKAARRRRSATRVWWMPIGRRLASTMARYFSRSAWHAATMCRSATSGAVSGASPVSRWSHAGPDRNGRQRPGNRKERHSDEGFISALGLRFAGLFRRFRWPAMRLAGRFHSRFR